MTERPETPTRVALCGAAPDELSELRPRLSAEGFEVLARATVGDDVNDLLAVPPGVVVIGSGAPLDDRVQLVRQIRRNARAASVRVLWLLRPGGEADAELALNAGADDVAVWSGALEGLVARVREQAIASRVRRAAEREAALRAELARVDEALDRADSERAALADRLTRPPADERWQRATTQPVEPPGPARESSMFGPLQGPRTVELTALDERVVDLFHRRLDALPDDRALSVLVAGIDAWDELVARRGEQLGRRLVDAVADLVASLIGDTEGTVALNDGRLCVLLPSADEATAVRLARDLCAQVASAPVKVTPRPFQPTVSVGVATLEGDRDGSPFDLVEWAGQALETARARGGNRWWVYHRGERD